MKNITNKILEIILPVSLPPSLIPLLSGPWFNSTLHSRTWFLVFYVIYFIPLGDLISSILFIFFMPLLVWCLPYSFVWNHNTRILYRLVYGPAQPAIASHCWLGRIAEWVRTSSPWSWINKLEVGHHPHDIPRPFFPRLEDLARVCL